MQHGAPPYRYDGGARPPIATPVMTFLADPVRRTIAGTMIGCLRKLQGWNLTSTLEEYRRHAGPKIRVLNEQFIELFDTDLVMVPPGAPRWLNDGVNVLPPASQ